MIIIGHRGAKGLVGENTLASLQKALEYKLDAIEIDVRITKDGVPVLNHNPYIINDISHEFMVSHHTYARLKKQVPDLATLKEAVETINRKVPLLVEVKPGEPVTPIVRVLEQFLRRGWKATDFQFCSFSPGALLELNKSLPAVRKIVNDRWSGIRASWRARQLGTKHISLNSRFLWGGFIKFMSRCGFEVYTYALNDPGKARKWEKYGLAGVITDFPDRFVKRYHEVSE